jgi:hypothetical protein
MICIGGSKGQSHERTEFQAVTFHSLEFRSFDEKTDRLQTTSLVPNETFIALMLLHPLEVTTDD